MTNPPTLRLGICFIPTVPPEKLRSLARAAEAAGLDEFWVWEDCFKESGVSTAVAALASTERIRVGIALMPAPLRNVALAAMEIATIDRMFPGRFVAGVGHGVQTWMEQIGARAQSPMGLLREYAEVLRRLLNGEKVSIKGTYVQLDEVALDWPPLTPPTLTMGGAGPKTLELAGELGDGTLLMSALTNEETKAACERTIAASRAARTGGDDRRVHDILAAQIVTTGPGAQARLDAELALWGKDAGAPIGAAGDAKVVADKLRQLAGFGVTSITVQPAVAEPDLEGLIKFLGQEVKPLLSADA
jgi:5,10-methylenetetrahydromethanopterin reductase